MKRDECTPQEEWVLAQLEEGKWAHLRIYANGEQDKCRLTAAFLEALLTDGIEDFKPHRKGLRITGAVVAQALDLENAEVAHIVFLDNFKFEKEVNCRDVRFARHLGLNNCQFSQKADFQRVHVQGNVFLRNAVFQGPLDFCGDDIGGQFNADGAQFQSEKEKADFNGLKVGRDAVFSGTVFQGPLDFRGADIGRQFNAEGAQFQSEKEKANFNGLKVGRDAVFRGTVFQGPLDFVSADIGEQFNAEGAQFQSEKEKADFNGLKVGQDAFFDDAIFQGPVDFVSADIGRQFSAEGAQFRSEKEKANFNGLKVGRSAVFRGTVFQGPVDFVSADIGRQFIAEGAQFQNEKEKANFNGLKVGRDAFFKDAIFQGPVDFVSADIGEQFSARRAEFKSSDEAIFEALKVGGPVFFEGAEFCGPVDLNHAHFANLLMGGKPIPELNLEHTRIDRELRIWGTEIDRLKARNLVVQGAVLLNQVAIKEEADLRYVRFQTLDLLKVRWPKQQDKVRLEGLTYRAISAGDKSEDPVKLLAWLDHARFHSQPYRQLESCWQQHGEQDWGDEAFLRMKKREAREKPLRIGLWAWTWFLIGLAGYGRKPFRPVLWMLGLICLSFFAFGNPEDMVAKKTSTQAVYANPALTGLYGEKDKILEEKGWEHYSWFWYTIDLMLPVDLEVAKYYEPKYILAWWYARGLPLVGWIIIAALAASLTGLFELKGHIREH